MGDFSCSLPRIPIKINPRNKRLTTIFKEKWILTDWSGENLNILLNIL